jgi:hypothetical protein
LEAISSIRNPRTRHAVVKVDPLRTHDDNCMRIFVDETGLFRRGCLPEHIFLKQKKKHHASKYLRIISHYFLVVMLKVISS